MKIDVRNITQRTKAFELNCGADELDSVTDIKFAEPLSVYFDCQQTSASEYLLKCRVKTTQVLECSRTLSEYENKVDLVFEIIIELKKTMRDWEVCDEEDEVYKILVNPNASDFDISEIVRQEILLHEPMVPVGDKDTSGDYIEEEEDESGIDPRWAALKKLKENK